MAKKNSNYKKIINVTSKLMGERGYCGVSVQMIADAIGVTKSTVFHHFKSKEGLLLAILDEIAPIALEEVGLIVDDKRIDGLEKLNKFIRHNLKLVVEKKDFVKLILSESRHLSEQKNNIYRQYQREYVYLAEKIVSQIQSENPQSFNNMNVRLVAHAILGMCFWAIMWLGVDEKSKHATDDIVNHLSRILKEKL
jgi:AcrR family transcriptional regulator